MFLLRTVLLRRLGPLGLILTVYDVWRRIPRRHREQILARGRSSVSWIAGLVAR